MGTVFLNGIYLPLQEAKISVLDRGFLFGDGVYEVIPAYGGKLFRMSAHMQRLDNSLQGIRVTNPHTREQWSTICQQLMAPLSEQDLSLYLQITRGVQAKRDHAFSGDLTPSVFAMASPIQYAQQPQPGVGAITLDDIRWDYCHIKATTLLPNVLLRQQAVDRDCFEAILIKNGYAMEGTASNLFVVDAAGVLKTPPKSHAVLPGITRDLLLELAQLHGIAHQECEIAEHELSAAREIWVTSSTKEIVPIVTLNAQTVGEGVPGPLWQAMSAHFAAYKDKIRRGEVT